MSHNYKKSFIDLCLSGECLLEDIHDFIDEWHDGDYPNELHEFLGMSWDEYSRWVSNSYILPYIVKARRDGVDFKTVLNAGMDMAHCGGLGEPIPGKEGNQLI